jgi:GTP-binding protein EngB required for normal cell division
MDVVKTIDNYTAVANFIEDGGAKALLAVMRQNLASNKYYLPFFGQFSAGKSKLINHLLGFNLLPTKSQETTAFITYISYGYNNTAIIKYVEGQTETICIEEVSRMDYAKVGNKVAEMHITINNPLLENGLTIVDTPGVNTIIEEHVEAAETLLKNSLYMVYVFGKSPTKSDFEMLDKIQELGISSIFVRTHIDQMHSTDEDNFKTIKSEKTDIENHFGREIKYFPVCNEKYESDNIKMLDAFDMFKDFLSNELSSDIAKTYAQAAEIRLKPICEKFEKVLAKRESTIKESSQKSIDELRNEQKQVEMLRKSLENIVSDNTKTQERKIKSVSDTIATNLNAIKEKDLNLFKEEINGLKITDGNLGKANALLSVAVKNTCQGMGVMATEQIANLANETSENFAQIIRDNIPSVEVNLDFAAVEASFDEQNAELDDAMEKIANIQKLKTISDAQIEQLGLSKQQAEGFIAEYDNFINQANSEVQEFINEHQPTYIQKESQLGKVLSGVGKVADIAMFFIPATGWSKLAKSAGKAANAMGKASKLGWLGQIKQNTLIQIGKAAKQMSKADKVLDASKILNTGLKMLPSKKDESTEKKTSIFDYLNVEYWLGKLGETIDPPTLEIDQNAETEFNVQVENMRNQIKNKVNERIMRMRQLGTISDDIAAERERRKLLDSEEAKLKNDIEELRKKQVAERMERYNDAVRSQCLAKFKATTDNYAEIVLKRSEQELAVASGKIINAANETVSKQLDETSKRLDEIINRRESNLKDDATALAEIAEFKNKLKIA